MANSTLSTITGFDPEGGIWPPFVRQRSMQVLGLADSEAGGVIHGAALYRQAEWITGSSPVTTHHFEANGLPE